MAQAKCARLENENRALEADVAQLRRSLAELVRARGKGVALRFRDAWWGRDPPLASPLPEGKEGHRV